MNLMLESAYHCRSSVERFCRIIIFFSDVLVALLQQVSPHEGCNTGKYFIQNLNKTRSHVNMKL